MKSTKLFHNKALAVKSYHTEKEVFLTFDLLSSTTHSASSVRNSKAANFGHTLVYSRWKKKPRRVKDKSFYLCRIRTIFSAAFFEGKCI